MKYIFSILRCYSLTELMSLIIFKLSKRKRYVYYKKENTKWAYISYLPEVFFRQHDDNYLNTHQNKRESLVMGQVFANNGFNFVVESFDTVSVDNRRYDIILGLEPNFCNVAKKNLDALKIYYATGAYYKHQNLMVKVRTDYFNTKHSCHVPYYRTVIENDAADLADFIFQIGSKYTLDTYPNRIRPKISLIDQSSNLYKKISIEQKLKTYRRNEFLWLGGGGSLLKGLDLVLDYFCQHRELILHVLGNINQEVNDYYSKNLVQCDNIFFHGFVDLNTDTFIHLAERVTFGIFPSASEGVPGAMIASMKCGIIPISSKYAAFDDIDKLGFMLNNLTIDEIEASVQWATQLKLAKISDMIMENYRYASKWSLENFAVQFETLLRMKIDTYTREYRDTKK